MAHERNKVYQSVTFTLRDGNTFTVQDNQLTKEMPATSAIEQFKANQLCKLPGGHGETIYVYPHSVSFITVTKTVATEEYTDDVCVEA